MKTELRTGYKAAVKSEKNNGSSFVNELLPKYNIMLKTKLLDVLHTTFKSEPPDEILVSETKVPISFERDSFICNLCLDEFVNKQGYMQHMRMHLQSDEGDAECGKFQEYKCSAAVSASSNQILLTSNIKEEVQLLNHDSTFSELNDPFVTSKYMDPETVISKMHVKDAVTITDQEFTNNNGELDWKLDAKCIVKLCDVFKMPVNYVPIENKLCTEKYPNGNKLIRYKFGQYKTERNSLLAIQLNKPMGGKPYSCKLCAYECVEHSTLLKHMKIHASKNHCVCSLCDYKCYHDFDLKMHMRVHTGEKSISCETCGRKFSRKSSLNEHMKRHTGLKPFACQLCNYRCCQSNSLVKHMRIHTGEKPFACEICNHKFSQKGGLGEHMRTHTGEKPFACEICNHKFSQKGALGVHMRTHTGDKPFSCTICEYRCADKSNLRKHLRTHDRENVHKIKIQKCKTKTQASVNSSFV